MIFADNRLHAMQAIREASSLKIMSDADMYYMHNDTSRNVDMTTTNNTNDTNTSVNRGTVKNKQGFLAGSVDAVQLAEVLDETQRVVDVNKLPEFFDRNVRQYNQNAGVNDEIRDVTVTDNIIGSGTSIMHGQQNNKMTQGIQALNEIRAHSLQLRRIREEFVQCFNVLFY